MIDSTTLHADLVAYCERIAAAPTTFGQFLFGDTGFAERLRRGVAPIGKVALAQRFMREHPAVPKRQFGAIAKAWRERVAAEGEADGTGGEARHAGDPGVAAAASGMASGSSTAGTLEESYQPHNREFHAAAGSPQGAGLAWILARLGGHAVVAADAGIAVTALEAMEAEGRIWAQHRRTLVACALRAGFDLDAETLGFRPVGRDFARSA